MSEAISRRAFLAAVAWQAMQGRTITIVAFGSSTTARREGVRVYADLLPAALAARGISARVVNSGVPGDTTERARARFDRDVLAHGPAIVVVQLGINDSAVDVWKSPPAVAPRVALEVYRKNLAGFVTDLRARGIQTVLMTPNALRWTLRLREMYGKPPYRPEDPDGLNVFLRKYAAAVRQVARENRAELADVLACYDATPDPDALLLDGMHPNDRGHRLVADLLEPVLVRLARQPGAVAPLPK